MISWRRKLKLNHYYFVLLVVISAFIKSNESCCEVITVDSTGSLSQFHPEHVGTYKLMQKDQDEVVYKSLTKPKSYIYLLRLNERGEKSLNHAREEIRTFDLCSC